MILLDTNVISELMKPNPDQGVVNWLDSQFVSTLYICAVTRAEIELGIALLPAGRRRQSISRAAQNVFTRFSGRCLAFDEMAAVQYAHIVAGRSQQGRPIHVEDAQIAAIALASGLQLATRNVKDFTDIPGLNLLNPWRGGGNEGE